jgi:hypothetical protein
MPPVLSWTTSLVPARTTSLVLSRVPSLVPARTTSPAPVGVME